MRVSIVLVASGEIVALAGVGLWSLPLALVLLGVQLAALGLLRESRTGRREPMRGSVAVRRDRFTAGVHRRRASLRTFASRFRPRLARGAAS